MMSHKILSLILNEMVMVIMYFKLILITSRNFIQNDEFHSKKVHRPSMNSWSDSVSTCEQMTVIRKQ